MDAIEELLKLVAAIDCYPLESQAVKLLAKWRDGDWAARILTNTQATAGALYRELSQQRVDIPPPPVPTVSWFLTSFDGCRFEWMPLENRWIERGVPTH